MVRFHHIVGRDKDGNVTDEQVQFTSEEETAWDAQEVLSTEKQRGQEVKDDRRKELIAKLSDDSITFEEMKELDRLERGL